MKQAIGFTHTFEEMDREQIYARSCYKEISVCIWALQPPRMEMARTTSHHIQQEATDEDLEDIFDNQLKAAAPFRADSASGLNV